MSASGERQSSKTLKHYASPEGARAYGAKYEAKLHKRISTAVERRLLDKVFSAIGQPATLLDMPSGPGRLYPTIAPHAEWTLECDYSIEMLKILREVALGLGRQPALVSADCFELPFRDRAFEAVVSIRLSHHIPREEDRERYLRELLRVCQKNCLFTFFDFDSVKNRVRRLRARLGQKKREKYAMRKARVGEIAERNGFEWQGSWAISRLFSGHQFMWLRRSQPTPPDLNTEPVPEGFDPRAWARLVDPETREPLRHVGTRLARRDGSGYPVVDGIPIMHLARRSG